MNIARVTREVIRRSRFFSLKRLSTISAAILQTQRKFEFHNERRNFSAFSKSPDYSEVPLMDLVEFESICSNTLESLTDYFEELVEADPQLQKADIAYSDGVLTVKLGDKFGTYVINRQTPNRQIWLSSPTSGPKRYDYIDDSWIYKHDGVALHQLLQDELSKIISIDVDFLKLSPNKK